MSICESSILIYNPAELGITTNHFNFLQLVSGVAKIYVQHTFRTIHYLYSGFYLGHIVEAYPGVWWGCPHSL